MTLHFTLTENDVLAFLERYLHDSKSYQKSRTRVRWSLPCFLFLMGCFFIWRDGILIPPLVLLVLVSVAWWLFYPRRLDASVRSRMKAQMGETGYARMLGSYELQLLEEHLHSKGPLGTSTLAWKSVDRVVLDSDYLHIFLSGGVGYPIRISEIGPDAAQAAHDLIASRIGK